MNRLKELRIKHGLNQKEIADVLDTTQQAISLYESGKREPKIETWQKLADYFNVSTSYLMGLNSNDFGNKIKELRIKNGFSQSDLAKATGLTRQAISNYERGDREPKMETWQKLADCFNVSIPSARGEIDTELIAKIAKLLLNLIDPSMDLLINGETVSEENKVLYEEMLLITLIDELGLNTEDIVKELKQEMWKSDFIKVLSEYGSEDTIKGGIKLVKLYDQLIKKAQK